ncbi:MAG: ABC-F family ATP-binding cassette domain-containing protein [Sphingobacteriales bacterium]|nr:ABC-F family ATP-binding cassette domain-containing protein [Sphingobacteriales bacterium]
MFVLQDITFEFGARVLYSDLSWHIRPKDKTGLIGANGTGKSTLLRIISGDYSPSAGEISRRNGLVIGFLNQDLLSYLSESSILEVAMEAFERANVVHHQIAEVLLQLEYDQSDNVLERLHRLQTEYEALDGYQLQSKAEAILEGLGFSTNDLNRPLSQFSGGWRMRVMLAKTLLQQPDLLLLDEPTNHLDLPSIQWLEQYLQEYEGAVIIVSHDRFFLDKTVNRIAEIEYSQLTLYKGNYSDYLLEKEERRIIQQNAFKNQEKYIREQERFIERFRAKATKATAVQSRIKALDRLERVDAVDDPSAAIKIRFAVDRQPGRIISKLDVSEKAYGSNLIFRNTQAEVVRGDKIAFIGANGKGKSTLLRMITGSEPFEGDAEPTHNVIPAFYAQHQLESLHVDNDCLEELRSAAPDESDTTLRSILGAFLLQGDDVFKKIKVLSGGERARVALAKTILAKANFLLLDEPTNHLDIQSVNVLVEVLNRYEGTYIVVSHDRYFLSRIANKIWHIQDHELKEYPGTYDEYELSKKPVAAPKPAAQVKQPAPEIKTKNEAKAVKPGNELQKKEKQRIEQQLAKLDKQLEPIRNEHEGLSQKLSDPELYKNKQAFMEAQQAFDACDKRLKSLESEWESAYGRLIELGT